MADPQSKVQSKPPIVAVVGHVDHGKTALLDYIRKTNIVDKEVGGITQSIGAYEVKHEGKKITFIDTPGHEAFTKMRAHGTSTADMAILVIAADESVKQQTRESLEILRATKTPFVVAITKIDKSGADIEKVKKDLMGEEVFLEGAGGNVSWQAVSPKTGQGIKELLDLILLMGEVAGLTCDPKADARGFVIESQKDSRRGIVVHLVLKDGTLRQGDVVRTLTASGKVKILEDFLGQPVEELKPSAPASVVGFEEFPEAGEEFVVGDGKLQVKTEKDKYHPTVQPPSEAQAEKLKILLKADTNGSLHALQDLLGDEVEIIGASAGDITDNDVRLARSTGSVIAGFMVETKKATRSLAEAQGVKVFNSSIIYELLDLIKEFKHRKKEEFAGGELKVLAVFGSTSSKRTIGGKVLRGIIKGGMAVGVEREGEIVGKGRIKSVQINKEDIREAGLDSECGLVIETTTEIKEGDLIKTQT
ncbi:MAG: hypothetical protein A2Y84_01510 [Candidatus Colwellbacteria bacterium RBG_13_48_8]|uniref:Tr-type G domain-containing protein n=1 Tax=Candidatus Colwellbacteria bacterium RBG_13_48_8 TaxID=1797685 RepID=A0A1G1YWI6_9BACT|nr:MAG: hypothetical protein A2Y84_01510 [Candidatus Colwellbacteria bacterium RBG_13_48_8]